MNVNCNCPDPRELSLSKPGVAFDKLRQHLDSYCQFMYDLRSLAPQEVASVLLRGNPLYNGFVDGGAQLRNGLRLAAIIDAIGQQHHGEIAFWIAP